MFIFKNIYVAPPVDEVAFLLSTLDVHHHKLNKTFHKKTGLLLDKLTQDVREELHMLQRVPSPAQLFNPCYVI